MRSLLRLKGEHMTSTHRLEVKNGDILGALRTLLQGALTKEAVRVVLAPRHLPMQTMVMPALIAEPTRWTGWTRWRPAFR